MKGLVDATGEPVSFGAGYTRWAWGRNLFEVEPSEADLADFLVWLKRQKKINPREDYPDMTLPLVFELYRHEYASNIAKALFPVSGGDDLAAEIKRESAAG